MSSITLLGVTRWVNQVSSCQSLAPPQKKTCRVMHARTQTHTRRGCVIVGGGPGVGAPFLGPSRCRHRCRHPAFSCPGKADTHVRAAGRAARYIVESRWRKGTNPRPTSETPNKQRLSFSCRLERVGVRELDRDTVRRKLPRGLEDRCVLSFLPR